MVKASEESRLTFKRWDANFRPRAVSIGDRMRFEEEYSKIIESEELHENFLSYPDEVQREIRKYVQYGVHPKTVGALYRTKRELQIKYPNTLNWWTAESIYLWKFNSTILELEAAEFAQDLRDFENVVYRSNRTRPQGKIGLMKSLLLSMRALHGDDPLLEVMQRWSEMSYIPYLHAFVELFENWEEYKGYPVDWSVNILSPDVIETGEEGKTVVRSSERR